MTPRRFGRYSKMTVEAEQLLRSQIAARQAIRPWEEIAAECGMSRRNLYYHIRRLGLGKDTLR